MIRQFKYKLAGMRKADSFVVYPGLRHGGNVEVQGDRTIGLFDPETGRGILNWRGSNSKYGIHLSRMLGAEPFTFPPEFMHLALECQPKIGDEIGPGITIGA